MLKAEIRRDKFTGALVVYAPDRVKRPGGGLNQSPKIRHPFGNCNLCPKRLDREKSLLEIPDGAGGWKVKVVANRFAILDPGWPKAHGRHELVIETPTRKSFEQFSAAEIETTFDVYAKRLRSYRTDPKLKTAMVFKNVGRLAGASLAHAHTQIIAGDFAIPAATKPCRLCAVLKTEIKSRCLVSRSSGIAAFAPSASRFPYELWLAPIAHRKNLATLTREERRGLAALLHDAVNFLARKKLAYNFVYEEDLRRGHGHVVIKILPRCTVWAGPELFSLLYANPIRPEVAAAEYRAALI